MLVGRCGSASGEIPSMHRANGALQPRLISSASPRFRHRRPQRASCTQSGTDRSALPGWTCTCTCYAYELCCQICPFRNLKIVSPLHPVNSPSIRDSMTFAPPAVE